MKLCGRLDKGAWLDERWAPESDIDVKLLRLAWDKLTTVLSS